MTRLASDPEFHIIVIARPAVYQVANTFPARPHTPGTP